MNKGKLIRVSGRFFRALLHSVFVFGFALICFISLNPVAPAKAQESQGRKIEGTQSKGINQISLLVEEGFTTLPLPLFSLTDDSASAGSEKSAILGKSSRFRDLVAQNPVADMEVVLKIEGRSAHFEQTGGGLIQSTINQAVVMLPAIKGDRADEAQAVKVLVDGDEIIEGLSVVVVPTGTIQALQQLKVENEAAFLAFTDHYAIIDTGKITNTSSAVVPVYSSWNGEPLPSEEAAKLMRELATKEEAKLLGGGGKPGVVYSASDSTIGGLVYWQMNDPKGAGFSYLPEHDNKLWWATPYANIVDGIYNKNWGCFIALKIPSYCTAYVYNSGYIGVCNPVYVIVRGPIRWVYPPNVDPSRPDAVWPKCPLVR